MLVIGLLRMESFYRDVILEKISPKIKKVKLEDVKKMEFNKGKFWVYINDGEIHSVPIKDVSKYSLNPCHYCCNCT